MSRDKYTLVVQTSITFGTPTRAYVLPTANLPPHEYTAIVDAAKKGGCVAYIFTVGDTGIEELKHSLETASHTKCD